MKIFMQNQKSPGAVCVTGIIMAIIGGAGALSAVETYTPVYVATATHVEPHTSPGTKASHTHVALQQVPQAIYQGVITSFNGSVLTDAEARLSPGMLDASSAGASFYLEISDGSARGLRSDILFNSEGGSLHLSDDISGRVSKGDTFVIRPHFTVESLFGEFNEKSGLNSGRDINDADNLVFIDNLGNANRIFNLMINEVVSLWTNQQAQRTGSMPVDPFTGFIIRRLDSNPVTVYNTGEFRTIPTRITVKPGLNFVGLGHSSRSITLDELGLYTGDPQTGIQSAVNPSEGDNIVLYSADGSSKTYFYLEYRNVKGWFRFDYTPAGDVSINPGQGFFISRLPGSSSFEWVPPVE